MCASVSKYLEDSPFDKEFGRACQKPVLHVGRCGSSRTFATLAARLKEIEEQRTRTATCCFIFRRSRAITSRWFKGIGEAGLGRGFKVMAPHRNRKAVWPRSGERARAER